MNIKSHPHSCLAAKEKEKKPAQKDAFTNALNEMFVNDGKKHVHGAF